jgi:hypothetical protein
MEQGRTHTKLHIPQTELVQIPRGNDRPKWQYWKTPGVTQKQIELHKITIILLKK